MLYMKNFFTTHKKSGFTVLELLIVVAIIGILSAIILSQVSKARARGRDTRRIEDVRTLQTALELYYTANYRYPTYDEFFGTGGTIKLTPTYIKVLPKDPKTGGIYRYSGIGNSVAACAHYHIGVILEQSNQALSFDSDKTAVGSGNRCGSAQADFSGTPALFYDLYK